MAPALLRSREMRFRNRAHAGVVLANSIRAEYSDADPLIVALPRGGVPVGFHVAQRLGAPMDVLMVRKIGAPTNPEFPVGAIVEDGEGWINPDALIYLDLGSPAIAEARTQAVQELKRQSRLYRRENGRLELRDRLVIIVDDGLATGATMIAAARSIRRRGANRIVIAVPVGSREATSLLTDEADRLHLLNRPNFFGSVSEWYDDYSQVTDKAVIQALSMLRSTTPQQKAS